MTYVVIVMQLKKNDLNDNYFSEPFIWLYNKKKDEG